jgi:predicted acetyltransferase
VSLGGVERTIVQGGMARVVSVVEALKLARMKGAGTLRVAVTDGQIPENNGTFEVRFAPGAENDVRRTDAAPDVACAIQDFSRLILGCCAFDPEWLPNVTMHGDPGVARQVFYPKPNYITQRF